MRFFRRRSRKAADSNKAPRGDLVVWWETAFTQKERDHILTKYQPLGLSVGFESGNKTLSVDSIVAPNGRPRLPLSSLATWFLSPADDLPLARRILDEAVRRGEGTSEQILDRHFVYQHMITVYYRDRLRDPSSLTHAIKACESQIALGVRAAEAFLSEFPDQPLPEHVGFKQLAIICEKQKDYSEAIRISDEALRQGWSGDWQKRIARCNKRMRKQS